MPPRSGCGRSSSRTGRPAYAASPKTSGPRRPACPARPRSAPPGTPSLVRELAAALGREARSKAVDILLAPTINLMRTPLGGRGFECFAEDPLLTAALAVAYVRGVQSAGVAATVKHFVGNDCETQRWTYDAVIAEDVLRELYLVPFEAGVAGGALAVMAAYNSVNGASMTTTSRCCAACSRASGASTASWSRTGTRPATRVGTALGGLDLAMPGPDGPWGDRLAAAVAAGTVSEADLDDKVLRLLRLARRVGALVDADSHTSHASHGASTSPAAGRPPAPPARRTAWSTRACCGARPRPRSCCSATRPRTAGPAPLDPAGMGTITRGRPERVLADDPGRRQRRRHARLPFGARRRAARGAGRAGHGRGGRGLPDLGVGARSPAGVPARPGDGRAGRPAGVPRLRRRAARRRAPREPQS